MIEPGQVYRSLDPRDEQYGDGPRRIKVVGSPGTLPGGGHYFGKVAVATLTEDGRELRRRVISVDQLHETDINRQGRPRRSGYVLEGS